MFQIQTVNKSTIVLDARQSQVGTITPYGNFKPAQNTEFSQQELEQLSEAVQRHLSVKRLKRQHMKTLILNSSFTPLCVVSGRRGIVLAYAKGMRVLEWYKETLRTSVRELLVPAVILYPRYVARSKKASPTKRAILKRDGMICQYCSVKLNEHTASIDHVKPVSTFRCKNDANTWSNMVACCKSCNAKKGNKMLYECEMRLISEPREIHSAVIDKNIPDEWKIYVGNSNR